MKLTRHEFLKLQKEWYRKVQESGFHDIECFEGDELVLSRPSPSDYFRASSFEREMREQYYLAICHAVHAEDTVFKNDVHRYVMQRHAEGAKAKTISEELEAKGHIRHRHSIRFIVRKYEMAWGLRTYDHKQIGLKKKA
jgi:hypothetical protein